jgi:glycosyltransferase involved in cell wall biosynthesis
MKVSLIIPAYNAERYLPEALASVFRQTRPPDEVIVVDDSSVDRTRIVAREFPVTLLQTRQNSGHAAARNIGIDAATGDVLAWLDADDVFEPHHLETVCGLLEMHSDAAVAFSGVRLIGGRTGAWTDFPCSNAPRHVFRECFWSTIVPAMSVVTRREATVAVGAFDPTIRVAPDFDFWIRMSARYKFVSTNEITANYRWHGAQISASPHRQQRSVYKTRWRVYERLRKAELEGTGMNASRAADEIAWIWENDLLACWREGDATMLRRCLALRRFVPGAGPVVAGCVSISHLPPWPGGLRHAVARAGAKCMRGVRRIRRTFFCRRYESDFLDSGKAMAAPQWCEPAR